MTWEQKGEDKGRWTEYINPNTGESSLKTHKPKLVKQWCPKGTHDYLISNIPKRIAECTKCQHEIRFRVGIDHIDGNKVTVR